MDLFHLSSKYDKCYIIVIDPKNHLSLFVIKPDGENDLLCCQLLLEVVSVEEESSDDFLFSKYR